MGGDGAGGGVVGVFLEIALRAAIVGAEPQRLVAADRRPDLDLAPLPARRSVLLIEREVVSARGHHPVVVIAPLGIGERVHLPRPATDDPRTDVLPLAACRRAGEAQHAVVLEGQTAQLQRQVVADRLDQPGAGRPAIVFRAHRGGHTLVHRRGPEALAAVPSAADDREAVAHLRRERARQLGLAALVDQRRSSEQAEVRGIGAVEFDRAGQCAGAERPRSAAASDADTVEPFRRDRRQRNIAEERIGHRHAVEQHQRAAGGVAAQRPQGDTLRSWIRRAAVGTAELLKPGDAG